jgi:uncharacterized protein (TIGR02266 family)
MTADNRRARRVPFVVEVSLESENNFFTGLASNVSEGGVFIATSTPPAVDTQVSFALSLEGQTFEVVGIVRWVREHFITTDQPAGCGVRFQNIDPRALEIIQRFIEFRPTDFYEE